MVKLKQSSFKSKLAAMTYCMANVLPPQFAFCAYIGKMRQSYFVGFRFTDMSNIFRKLANSEGASLSKMMSPFELSISGSISSPSFIASQTKYWISLCRMDRHID